MGLFGNKEEKQAQKEREKQAIIDAERARLAQFKNKYITQSFTNINDNRYAIQTIFSSIADYANTYNLEIVKISGTSEGFISKAGVTVIFKVL